MTREKTLMILNDMKGFYGRYNPLVNEALDVAIVSIKNEPCEDAISREEALECFPVIPGFGFIGSHYNVETIRHQLRNCPSVQPKAKSEWIPIKTRPLTEKEKAEMGTESDYMYDCPLPDDGEEVEVTTYLGDVTLDVFCRDSSDGCYFEHYCDDGDVVAWRHKPEPYKVESEEVYAESNN